KTVYNYVFDRFHRKYKDKLTESQKRLLTTYASYKISKDPTIISGLLVNEIKNIKERLSVIKDESLRNDKDLMKKLKECYQKFSENIKNADINEEFIMEILKYMQLSEEVES